MNVFTFKDRFEAPVLAGVKIHTLRGHRRDGRPRAVAGERISLRVWTGRPYGSKQREFAQATVERMEDVSVFPHGIETGVGSLRLFWMGEHSRKELLDAFARKDGFADWAEMKAFFQANGGLPFEGSLIVWTDLVATRPTE